MLWYERKEGRGRLGTSGGEKLRPAHCSCYCSEGAPVISGRNFKCGWLGSLT